MKTRDYDPWYSRGRMLKTMYFIMTDGSGCLCLWFMCFLYMSSSSASSQDVVEMSDNDDVTESRSRSGFGFGFASYYSDHMVLQRAPHQAVIWGYSPWFGDKVTVSVGNTQTHHAEVGKKTWTVKLDPVSHPGPYQIIAKSTFETIILDDVVFGDVWVCSGQSNMEFTVAQCFNASEEIQDANYYPFIRLFTVNLVASDEPWEDFEKGGIMQPWSVASNETVNRSYGKNVFSAVCWFYGKHIFQHTGYPVGLIATSYGGTKIETWSSPDAIAKCGKTEKLQIDFMQRQSGVRYSKDGDIPSKSSVLWNSMIHPLLKMTIYGAIWYQGEANTPSPHTYNCTFPAMIFDWRLKWNQGSRGQTSKLFPFGFVTLGPDEDSNQNQRGYPEVRWHQTADYGYVPNPAMPNTFTALAFDLPDFFSPSGGVHIRDKQDVAARLFLGGLALAYHQKDVEFQGPIPTGYRVQTQAQTIHIIYNSTRDKIDVRTRVGFEICCAFGQNKICDNKTSWWLQAPVVSVTSQAVCLSTKTCSPSSVAGIRYAWRISPCSFKDCAVYSTDSSLPAVPFLFTSRNFGQDGMYKIDLSVPHTLYG